VNATRTQPVCVVARQRGIARSLLFRWRKEAGLSGQRWREKKPAQAFAPVVLPAAEKLLRGAPAQGADGGLIEIVLAGGCQVRLSGGVDPGSCGRQGVAGGGAYGHAQGLRWPCGAGAGEAGD
jgi:hypothetical protein